MKLIVVGSSSKGNLYALRGRKSTLLLECGLPLQEAMKAIDFDRRSVCGCLVSHRHSDHARYLNTYAAYHIPCFVPQSLEVEYPNNYCVLSAKEERQMLGDGFSFFPFSMVHDVECYAYLITHPEMGETLFVTDTEYVPQDLSDIEFSHIMIEANYSDKIIEKRLNDNPDAIPHLRHIMKGHMSIENVIKYLHSLNLSQCETITLLHLSDENSNEFEFRKTVQDAFPKVRVYVASAGEVINFNKKPY